MLENNSVKINHITIFELMNYFYLERYKLKDRRKRVRYTSLF